MKSRLRCVWVAATMLPSVGTSWAAQPIANQPTTQSPPSARAQAPIDLTGYWVSLITQDWRYRMVVPGKGEYAGMPLTPEAKRVADTWDPARDAAGGDCKAYGVGAIMRVPERLHITWQDENTLKVETDAGKQIRLLRFNAMSGANAATSVASRQGLSVASWVFPAGESIVATVINPASRSGEPSGPGEAPRFGSLKVFTNHVLPGYLRANGVPYSGEMTMTEYWDIHKAPNGDQWLTVTTELNDPQYLQFPYIFSPNFKKEADGSKWDPSPCSSGG